MELLDSKTSGDSTGVATSLELWADDTTNSSDTGKFEVCGSSKGRACFNTFWAFPTLNFKKNEKSQDNFDVFSCSEKRFKTRCKPDRFAGFLRCRPWRCTNLTCVAHEKFYAIILGERYNNEFTFKSMTSNFFLIELVPATSFISAFATINLSAYTLILNKFIGLNVWTVNAFTFENKIDHLENSGTDEN